MTLATLLGDVAIFVAGAVCYHFFATKVLGYVKQAASNVATKL